MTFWEWLDTQLGFAQPPVAPAPVPVTIIPKEPVKTDSMEPTTENPDVLVEWVGEENCRHNVRVLCDFEGLPFAEKNALSQTIHCESNYNPACVHPNMVGDTVASTDFGICAINDFYHIGPGKDFPNSQFVLDNPEACVRWMCKQWLAGNGKLWVCYLRNMYLNFTP